tara:strand:+ start:24960 stop:25244 length:285 start_codon:yes stop_codon:yes gene_type:complete
MASKDFIYDLLDKLEEERLEYVLLTMTSKDEEASGDLYYNFYYEDSKDNAAKVLKKLSESLDQHPDGEIDDLEIDLSDEDDYGDFNDYNDEENE